MTDIPRGQGGDGSPQLDLDAIEAQGALTWERVHERDALLALVRRLQQENKDLRKDDEILRLRGRVEELTEALRSIRRVLNDDGDGAGPGAMFSMIDRHLEAAGFLT